MVVRVWFFRVWVMICAGGGLAQAAPGDTLMDEGFRAAQWAHLSSAGAALRQTAQRRESGTDALAELLRARQLVLDQIDLAGARLAASGGTAAGENLGQAAALGGEIDALQSDLGLIEARLAVEFPDFLKLTAPRTLSVAEVQALLAPDEGLVMIFTGQTSSFVWAITPRGAAWHRVDLPEVSLRESVTEIRRSLIQANTLRAAAPLEEEADTERPTPPFAGVHAQLLYSELLSPLEPHLAGVAHLYTVVDGPLSGLPLSLLITEWAPQKGPLEGAERLRETQWLFQRHALTTLPSVEALDLIAAAPGRPRGQGFLGFGDPVFAGALASPGGGSFFRSGAVDLDSLRALAPLPGTRRELRQLATLMQAGPGDVFLGADATEPAVRAAPLADAAVIAFATHGLLSGELRGLAEPALVLTPPEQITPQDDGLLTASEISELDLRADWVILSACNTAGGDGSPDGEGLSGLARAFLFAGARTLMVSHWPVRDDAAARLTTDTIASLRADGPARRKAAALQGAMQAMLMDPDHPDMAHPAAWAPFVLVGHGGV